MFKVLQSKPKLAALFLSQTLNMALFLGTLEKCFQMFFYLTRYLLLKIGEVCLVLFQLFFLLVMFSKKLDLFSCCLEHLMQLLIVFYGEANLDLCFLKSLLLAYLISLLLSKVSQLDGSYWPYKKANYHIQLATVKPVLTNTFLKRPPVLNDHVVVFPQVFRLNISLYRDHLYNATNDHLHDVPGFLLPAYNDHCTKCLSQKS